VTGWCCDGNHPPLAELGTQSLGIVCVLAHPNPRVLLPWQHGSGSWRRWIDGLGLLALLRRLVVRARGCDIGHPAGIYGTSTTISKLNKCNSLITVRTSRDHTYLFLPRRLATSLLLSHGHTKRVSRRCQPLTAKAQLLDGEPGREQLLSRQAFFLQRWPDSSIPEWRFSVTFTVR